MKKLISILLFISALVFPSSISSVDQPIVGAIRWDNWYGNLDATGHATELSLGPSQWHFRVPFFGKIISDTHVQFSYTQGIIDQEIAHAKAAGLSYWAFNLYPPDSHLSDAIKLYLSSSFKPDINLAVIASPQIFGDDTYGMAPFVQSKKQRLISIITDPNYQKVLDNRAYLSFWHL